MRTCADSQGKEAWKTMRQDFAEIRFCIDSNNLMYAWFVAAFRSAAEKLKQGDREARFPVGSFPPGLPFVAG
jgi:hypothetical protein